MHKIFSTLLFIIFISGSFSPHLRAQANIDSVITSIVSRIDSDSVRYAIQNLQDLQTRFMLSNKRFDAADWLYNRFTSLGFTDVERDSFMCTTNFDSLSTTLQVNIIATLPGTLRPDEIYIIGGHYDSFAYGSPMTNAPGADDNASGTSAALEFARVLMESGYQPEATIKFIVFAAEELMLFGDAGCEHYAQKAYDDSMNIKLMINCDMISYNIRPLEQAKVSINYYSGYTSLLNLAKNVTDQFSLITGVNGVLNQYSDSYPFYEKGFPAIYFEEEQFSPYYHSTDDVISNYDMDYCSEVIKSAGSMILKYIDMNSPTDIENEEILVKDFELYQNYPNPFNPNTKIKFTIPTVETHRDASLLTTLRVYDILGTELATLVNEYRPAGNYEVDFQSSVGSLPTGQAGHQLANGVYFYRLQVGDFIETKKMILLK